MNDHSDNAQTPLAAQVRYRHPQRNMPDWSPWQPAKVDVTRPVWSIDSMGYETEYRLLYSEGAAHGDLSARCEELAAEVHRLHVELAKANGACGEMSYELSGVLHDLHRVEHQRDVMQHRLEQAEHMADVSRGALHHVSQLLGQMYGGMLLEDAHRIVSAVQQTVLTALGRVPDPKADVGGHSDAG